MIITIIPPDEKRQDEPANIIQVKAMYRPAPIETMRYQVRAQYGIRGYYDLPESFKEALTEHASALVEQQALCQKLALAEQKSRVKKATLDDIDIEFDDDIEDINADDKEDVLKFYFFTDNRARTERALRVAEQSLVKIKNELNRANERVDETKSELLDHIAMYPKFHVARAEEKVEELYEVSLNNVRI